MSTTKTKSKRVSAGVCQLIGSLQPVWIRANGLELGDYVTLRGADGQTKNTVVTAFRDYDGTTVARLVEAREP